MKLLFDQNLTPQALRPPLFDRSWPAALQRQQLVQRSVMAAACALPRRKRFPERVGDAAHLSSCVVNHAVLFRPGREANGKV